MIIIIDSHTDTAYYSKYKYKIADLIGIHRNTITNWLNGKNQSEQYNHLKIYLYPKEL